MVLARTAESVSGATKGAQAMKTHRHYARADMGVERVSVGIRVARRWVVAARWRHVLRGAP